MTYGKERILFVENHVRFLRVRSIFLERAGFEVLKAKSVEEARAILEQENVHLILLDIRVRDDEDPEDTSGVDFARELQGSGIPVVILTNFDDTHQAIELLRTGDGAALAVDYLRKTDDPEKNIQVIRNALNKSHPRNPALRLRFAPGLSLFQLFSAVDSKPPSERMNDRKNEFEDLLHTLFHQGEQVFVGKVLRLEAGRVLISVLVRLVGGREQRAVVLLGCSEKVHEELSRFHDAVPKQSGFGEMVVMWSHLSLHYGGAVWSPTGAGIEPVGLLTEILGSSSAEISIRTINFLFQKTLKPWYRGQKETACNLLDFCGNPDTATLDARIRRLYAVTAEAGIDGYRVRGNSMEVVADGRSLFQYRLPGALMPTVLEKMPTRLSCGTIHGNLHPTTVLANHSGSAWLGDYRTVRHGPLLWEFVALENGLKFDARPALPPVVQHDLELHLLQDEDGVRDEQGGFSAETAKLLQMIRAIRNRAYEITGCDPETYQQVLLWHAIQRLYGFDSAEFSSIETLQSHLNATLSVLMLTNRIALPSLKTAPDTAPLPQPGLHYESESGEMWMDGKSVHLSGQELLFAVYLYERRNKWCDRRNIATYVMPEDMQVLDWQTITKRLNVIANRVRKRIEPDPKEPCYIITKRGHGYKLCPTGEELAQAFFQQ